MGNCDDRSCKKCNASLDMAKAETKKAKKETKAAEKKTTRKTATKKVAEDKE